MLMQFSTYKAWFTGKPMLLRWFLWLILLRPVIDAFYFLKDISPYLSPLYIVGVFTPLIALYAILRVPRPNYSRLDTWFGLYTLVIGVSCLALFLSDSFSLNALDMIFKVMLPSSLYFFCRALIRSKLDMDGILQTFLYSSFSVVLIFAYELMFNPINIQISRGFERFQGTFADTMNYSIYMTGGLIIAGYQMFQNRSPYSIKTRGIFLTLVIGLSITLLFNIHHTASYLVVAFVALLILLHYLKTNIVVGIITTISAAVIIYFAGADAFQQNVLPLIETDIMVYQGEKDDEALLHGRVGRWQNFYRYFDGQSPVVQILGLPLNMESPYMYIGKGSHNDFVRHHMFIGFAGLSLYLFILANLFVRVLKHKTQMHYLGLATLSAVMLFSVTTTPLLYPTLMYIVMPVVAMLALPPQIMEHKV